MKDIKNKEQTLLILDLDETLVFGTHQPLDRKADFVVFDYHIYTRPFLNDFLKSVNEHFKLAVWSSATDEYVEEVVKNIIPTEISLEFVWGRSRCTYRRNLQMDEYGYYDDNPRNHYHFVKPLKKLKTKGFRLERILIVDDTPHKSRDNYGNAIYPKEYLGATDDDELIHLEEYLISLKDIENVRTIEKRGWRTHNKKSSQ